MENNINYSVLMSVYYKDNAIWLEEAIESILAQTVKTNDFVIIEDGIISEKLESVILSYEKKYPKIFHIIRNKKNQGLGPSLAEGILKCKNKYIARMDSDDISIPTRIEKELKIIISKDLDIVGSNIAEFTNNINNIQAYRNLPEIHEEILKYSKRRNPFGHPSVILNKDKVIEAGNFRSYYLCEDYDMWIRMLEKKAKCYNIQEYLVYMRISEDFYKRRGGIKYLKSILKFKKEQYRNGFYTQKDFFISSTATFITCLVPNFARELVYKKLLRNK